MIIKKVTTIEIDDSIDLDSSTRVPQSLAGGELKQIDAGTPADFPQSKEIEESEKPQDIKPSTIIGRTFPDLVIEFKNDSRFMSTILMFLSFIIFVNKIDSIESLKYPIIMGIILNLVWFFPKLIRIIKKRKKDG